MRIAQAVPWLVAAAVLTLPLWLTPNPVLFKDFSTTAVVRLLTGLTAIALFLERGFEVFITTTRSWQAEQLDLAVNVARREGGDLAAAEKALVANKSQTHRMASWTGLAFGVLVSAAGVRTLEMLVDANALNEIPEAQAALYRVAEYF